MARGIYHFAFETPLRSDVLLGELSRPRGVPELPPRPPPRGACGCSLLLPLVGGGQSTPVFSVFTQYSVAVGIWILPHLFSFGELGKCRPSPCALVQGRFQGAELEADCATWLCFSSGVSRAQ